MTPRWLISLCLALMMVLTSQAMATARVSADAAGQMVLCIGSQEVTVYVDAEGQPVAAPHFCPDCALLDHAEPKGPAPLILAVFARSGSTHSSAPAAGLSRVAATPPARAPPVLA